MKMDKHPTVIWYDQQKKKESKIISNEVSSKIGSDWLSLLCTEEGADDVGFVSIDNSDISKNERQDLFEILPEVKTIITLAFKLNNEAINARAHSIANLEFHLVFKQANDVCRRIVSRLQDDGIIAVNAAAGFPSEADRWPGKMSLISNKLMAERCGLGKMGWNRLVIHPQYGAAVVLNNILIDKETTAYDDPLSYNPCIECKLCVSACPTGAISNDGHFNFVSCYTHNYREKLGGFIDWVESLAGSRSVKEYRKMVDDNETLSMWQNLSIASQTRCDRCMAVCPAGRNNIAPFLSNRAQYMERTIKWMRAKKEIIYVVRGSDAESYVKSTFPHKVVKAVGNGIRPNSIHTFLAGLPLLFQRDRSQGLDANYHFTFTGDEPCQASVRIKDKSISVEPSHLGRPDLHLIADSGYWLRFLAKEQGLLAAIVKRKIRIKGPLRLLQAFDRCFPS